MTAMRSSCWQPWTTPTARSWPNARPTPPPTRSRCPSRCWTAWTSPTSWSPPTRRDTQRAHAEYLVGRRAHYLLVVKANQPTLHAQLAGLAWRDIPVADRTRDHAHGRIELRTLKAAAVAGLGFPHAAQAIQATRRAREPASRRWRTETVYAVTSLALGSASPAQLAGYLRGHRRTENQLHWARDVTFADHASRARTGNLPHTMASLRIL